VVAAAALNDQQKCPGLPIVVAPRARGPRRRSKEKQDDCEAVALALCFSTRVRFQRTATRQLLDCARTLSLCSQENRRTLTFGGLLACSRSNPRWQRP